MLSSFIKKKSINILLASNYQFLSTKPNKVIEEKISKNEIVKKTTKKIKPGYLQFHSDTKKIYDTCVTCRTPALQSLIDCYKKDDEALLNYSYDRVMTVPKGQSIQKKNSYILNKIIKRPKGARISEFPESDISLTAEEAVKLIIPSRKKSTSSTSSKVAAKTDIAECEKSQPKSDFSGDEKSQPKKTTKKSTKKSKNSESSSLEFDTKALSQLVENTVDITIPVKEVQEPYKNEIAKKREEDKAQIRKILELEDQQRRSTKKFISFLEQNKINSKFLNEQITDFPFLSRNQVLMTKDDYTTEEIISSNEYLFENANEIIKSKARIPTVTDILELSKSNAASEKLLKWKIEKCLAMGIEGFTKFNEKTRNEGTQFHNYINKILRSGEKPGDIEFPFDSKMKANLEKILCELNDTKQIEIKVTHTNLLYTGRVDCMAYYEGSLCMFEWKTSDKSKPDLKDLYEQPIQLAAYIGAFLNDPAFEQFRSQNNIQKGIIINFVKNNNGDYNFHSMNHQLLEFYWHEWLHRVKAFWNKCIRDKKLMQKNLQLSEK